MEMGYFQTRIWNRSIAEYCTVTLSSFTFNPSVCKGYIITLVQFPKDLELRDIVELIGSDMGLWE